MYKGIIRIVHLEVVELQQTQAYDEQFRVDFIA